MIHCVEAKAVLYNCIKDAIMHNTMTITVEQIESAIYSPAKGQAELFLEFAWLVPTVDGQIWGDYATPPFTVDYAFTQQQRFEPLLSENQRGKEFETNPHPLMTPDGWNIVRPMYYQPSLERCRLVPVSGRELFKRLAARDDYHTLHINSSCGSYDDPLRNGEIRMPCGWTPLVGWD
ncbi:MAG: hypothetical protein U0930_11530 [Pirellulales bacterium]